MPRISAADAGGANVVAFLRMLTQSEIEAWVLANSDDGYNVLVGSHGPGKRNGVPYPGQVLKFDTYAAHPNVLNRVLNSSAAGAYQLLARYYEPYRKLLGLRDFSPESQDRIAIQQIREKRALPLIQAGNFAGAVAACNRTWASLTGSPYGQRTNPIELLQGYYVAAGGVVRS
ncbi:glycoside hydrolase family 104 protein [Paraburkholderia tropica]|uniref:glycoside hydrolase family 24 protein n=1 Tax=Paraburkholderia tropica TaxID=92647 RepID=UPI001600F906|nr:glycoside hydrolase family 104 protein [Paraburkholderia tropica]QNB11552.1 glycoside hydrolase family 104 protein [Paraburkholderia tropica]